MRQKQIKRRYKKVYPTIWTDENFRNLSRSRGDAQTLFLYLLTCSENGMIPGIINITKGGLASRLGWDISTLEKHFAELGECYANVKPILDFKNLKDFSENFKISYFSKADWDVGLVFVPMSLFDNPPHNLNVVKSWIYAWNDIPDCSLKIEISEIIKTFLSGFGKSYFNIAEMLRASCAYVKPDSSLKIKVKVKEEKELEFKAISKDMENVITTSCDASKEDDPNSNSQTLPSKPKKRNPSLEKKKKRLAEAKEKAKSRLKNNSLPTPDLSQSKNELFAADEANRNTMLTILDSKKKPFAQKKKKLEDDLHEEFLRVYCAEKYRETGNGLPPDGKHIQPACIKLAKYCLKQNIRPEKYIGYWVENNFTKLDFPTMTFLSGDKQIEAANIAFSKTNGKSRKNGKKQKEEYGHSFTGELDRGFRDALRSGGFDKALKMTDRELMTYQVVAKAEKEKPGDFGMSDDMREIVDYLVENFYN